MNRREAREIPTAPPAEPKPAQEYICRVCGTPIPKRHKYCARCVLLNAKEQLLENAKRGRIAAHSLEAEARRSQTQQRQAIARAAWRASDQPAWLDEKTYLRKIQPRLAGLTVPAISSALRVTEPYAANIRAGRRRPHPRHWRALAKLANISEQGGEFESLTPAASIVGSYAAKVP